MDSELFKFAKITRDKDCDTGNVKTISGECTYLNVKFRFHIYGAKKKGYDYVLIVTAISPATKKSLQSSKKLKKLEKTGKITATDRAKIAKGQTVEKLNAEQSAYLKKSDIKSDKRVREKVQDLVVEVFADNQDDIFDALKIQSDISSLNTRTVFEMHQNDYFHRGKTVTDSTLKEKKRRLKKFCTYLCYKPIGQLVDKDIESAANVMSKSDRGKTLNLAKEFFDYCGEIGVYSGRNPVERYLKSADEKLVSGDDSGRLYPYSSSHLKEKAEKVLHELIAGTLMDDLALSIPLVKGFRITIDRLLELLWEDILIEGNEVRINDYKDNYTGGTHNYIRPPLRETADFIIAKYKALKKEHGITKLKKMRVVPVLEEGAPIAAKKAELSKYFLKMLRKAGVSNDDLKRAKSPGSSKESGGSGYTLLIKHYDYVLQERCGIKLTSGLGCYLRGIRIYDSTTDFYRSLSDATGDNVLQVIMRRDDIFVPVEVTSFELSSRLTDNGREIIAPPAPPGTRTAISTKKRIFIPKGSKVLLFGALVGTVRCRKEETTFAADKKVKIY